MCTAARGFEDFKNWRCDVHLCSSWRYCAWHSWPSIAECERVGPAHPPDTDRHPGHPPDSSTDRARRGEERDIVVRLGRSGERVERIQDAPHEGRGGGVVRPQGAPQTLGTEDLTGRAPRL